MTSPSDTPRTDAVYLDTNGSEDRLRAKRLAESRTLELELRAAKQSVKKAEAELSVWIRRADKTWHERHLVERAEKAEADLEAFKAHFEANKRCDFEEHAALKVELAKEKTMRDAAEAQNEMLQEAIDSYEAELAAERASGASVTEDASECIVALDKCQTELATLKSEKDQAYLERNHLVAALAHLFPSGLRRTDIPGWSADWHGCCMVDLPSGQISYHYHDNIAHLFDGLPPYTGEYDGHSKDDVHARLAALKKACLDEGDRSR